MGSSIRLYLGIMKNQLIAKRYQLKQHMRCPTEPDYFAASKGDQYRNLGHVTDEREKLT